MKKIVGLILVIAACRTTSTSSSGGPSPMNQIGAADAPGALRAFVAAGKAEDLQAMSAVWGTSAGPARSTLPASEVESRLLFLLCYLKHDRYSVLGTAPGTAGRRVMSVQLTLGDLTRTSNFTAVPGPNGRWFLENFDVTPLTAICARK